MENQSDEVKTESSIKIKTSAKKNWQINYKVL
jgi:hypothetical protein